MYAKAFTFGTLIAIGTWVIDSAAADGLNSHDRDFVKEAAKSGLRDVQMGQLGVSRGTSEGVKAFSQRILDETADTNAELRDLADKKAIQWPSDQPTMHTHLTQDAGAGLDSQFVKAAVGDQEKDVKRFEHEAKSGKDPELKAWAESKLPMLKARLETVKSLLAR